MATHIKTPVEAKAKTKTKKMSNEGHTAKVPKGGAIGLVFIIGLVVGGIVTFLAVAGRTEGIVQQRRAILLEKQNKTLVVPQAEAPVAPALPSETPTPKP